MQAVLKLINHHGQSYFNAAEQTARQAANQDFSRDFSHDFIREACDA
jgi:hypothetical protein